MEKNYNRRTEKDYNFWRMLFYKTFVTFVVWSVTKYMYNLKIIGRENIPKTSRVIFAGNHVSYLDPPIVSLAVKKCVAYMAKQELFHDKNKLLRFLVHILGAFAVNREKPELATFKTVKSIFNTSWSLGIFPQGKIIKEPVISNIQKGFVLFAKKFEADIVPVGIKGFDGYAKKLFEKHITVTVGKPISYKLPEEEIIQEWARQICEYTGFENKLSEEIVKL
jgi:1-acyl-sn-glycerol-3-phosphate acyltransferase